MDSSDNTMYSRRALRCRAGAVVLPMRLFPPASYYAVAAAFDRPLVNTAARFNKRDKAVHRYSIADVRGRLELTVPVCKAEGRTSAEGVSWKSIGVSAHGRWWEVHRIALESAYGRTPFFEYYIDRLAPLFAERPLPGGESAADLCLSANSAVCSILGLKAPEACVSPAGYALSDFDSAPTLPYWQVRADRLGFIPALSILDVIFNLGPEAPVYLLELQRLMNLR